GTSIFFGHSNRRNICDFECHKIITRWCSYDLFQNFFQFFRGVRNFPEQKIYIYSHTAVKAGNSSRFPCLYSLSVPARTQQRQPFSSTSISSVTFLCTLSFFAYPERFFKSFCESF